MKHAAGIMLALAAGSAWAQSTTLRLMPNVNTTSDVVASGATAPAGLAFSYTSRGIRPGTDYGKKHVKVLTCSYTSQASGAVIDAQAMRLKREKVADEGDVKYPMDICIVDYSRRRPYDPMEPSASPVDTIFWPTFMEIHGDENHTDCEPPKSGPLCVDPDDPKHLTCCCGPGDGTTQECADCPATAGVMAATATTAATPNPRQTAAEMFLVLAATPVKPRFERYKAAMLNALATQTTEGVTALMHGVVNAVPPENAGKPSPGTAGTGQPDAAGTGQQSDFLGDAVGEAAVSPPIKVKIAEPNAVWCATHDWNYTWRHWIGVFQGDITLNGQPLCDLGRIQINRGRCSHAATVLVNWNPCSGEPQHVTKMNKNHGRPICMEPMSQLPIYTECPNGLRRTAWMASCPYRTVSMAYARGVCGTPYSAFSNGVLTPAVKFICPRTICPVGHNCNDDATFQWWMVANWLMADPITGPPAVPGFTVGGDCGNFAGHYDMTAADRTSPQCPTTASCSGWCP